jgi:hypothetical protein
VSPQPGLISTLADTDHDGESDGFLPAVTENLRSYVYLLIDPRSEDTFTVGTGTGDRCFRHLDEARRGDDDGAAATIREIEAAGHRVRIDVLRHGLDATTAAIVAAAVTEALGLPDMRERAHDDARSPAERVSVGALNARYGAKPITIDPDHRVVLIRIPKAFRRGTDHQRYEMTRGWWRAGARRERAEWAFAVDEGVVRAVYRIDGWEPARAGNCWGFRGRRDHDMERSYLHGDVSGYLTSDSPLPLHYVNC